MFTMTKRMFIAVGVFLACFTWLKYQEKVASVEKTAVRTREQVAPATSAPPSPPSLSAAAMPAATPSAKSEAQPPNQVPPPSPPPPLPQHEDQGLTVDGFTKKFRARDFTDWLKESKKFKNNAVLAETGLNIGHESGVIRVGEKAVQYRYNFVGNNSAGYTVGSCAAIFPDGGEMQMGILSEGTLTVYRGPMDRMHILAINDKDFFVRFWDIRAFPSLSENSEPAAPINYFTILYYQRQPDDKITYQGKLEKLTSADPDMKLSGEDFCRYSFGAEFEDRWEK